jgi:hypothetical protein
LRADLFSSRNKLDHFLQSSSAMLVQRNLYQLGRSIINESSTLLVVRIFKKFLAEIVSKRICKTGLLAMTRARVGDFNNYAYQSSAPPHAYGSPGRSVEHAQDYVPLTSSADSGTHADPYTSRTTLLGIAREAHL